MTITRLTPLPPGSDFRSLFERSAIQTGFVLLVEDKVGINCRLRRRSTDHAANSPLLNGLLRHKLRISRSSPEPAPDELVVAGRHVTYTIIGEGARSGVLTMNPSPIPGHILVASLLGAALIGMRKLQRGHYCGTKVRSTRLSCSM